MIWRILLACFALTAVSCTHTYNAQVNKGSLAGYSSYKVTVEPEYSGDEEIKNAISLEVQKRLASGSGKTLEVKYADHWTWDIVMYLLQCRFTFVDANSQEIKATVFYRNSPLHSYPSQKKVVEKVFIKLDEKGAFQR